MYSSTKLIIDTGFIVALLNEDDEHHSNIKKLAGQVSNLKWYTTHFVIQEIFWLLSKRKNLAVARMFIQKTPSLMNVSDLPGEWFSKISSILGRYATANIDLADASLVVLADHLKTGQIVSVDRKDFSILRWNGGKSHFHNLIDDEC